MNSGLPQGFKLRVRTGCNTCRIRKVKCDEGKPTCQRCTSTSRTCDGYSRSPSRGSPIRSPPTRSLSPSFIALPVFDDDQQRSLFRFFVSCTAVVAPIYYGKDFWSRRVLQLSLSEPAVRYAICGLSALHRMFRAAQENTLSPDLLIGVSRSYALQQYNLAVNHTHKLITESLSGAGEKIVQGLVACILFVCFENQIGNFQMAQVHLQHGLKILALRAMAVQSGGEQVPSDIQDVFHRLDLQAMSFADDTAPYLYDASPEKIELDTTRSQFESLDEAGSSLIRIFRWSFRKASECEPNPISYEDLEVCTIALSIWTDNFADFMARLSQEATEKSKRTITLLGMYQRVIHVMLSVGLYGEECRNDSCETTFSEIVHLGEQALANGKSVMVEGGTNIYSFEMGVICPLFVVGIKCRNPRIRRHALKLLKDMRLQEGSWESIAAARTAEFVIEIEEQGLAITDASQIRECARVHITNVSVDAEHRRVKVSCLLCLSTEETSWYFRKRVISY
ncbi:hypothetical protein BJ875DRAFT_444036 [Amylocarpus encephaloides]|uniref:Zn(2)-C6 fungal-type domain-containing protein n=1 Tax=Amylocarpus encephaloides TaxID=45428 RepID=A0A9P7YD69_9HELO|nr:hypothetical protein BJ875DRAFT_444036 [Amylocarpus encephaloides]